MREKISFEIKQKAVTEIESGRLSQSEAARRLGIKKKKTSGTHATGLTHECHSLYGIIILLHKKSAGHSAQIARCKLCGKSPLKPWSGLCYNRKERKRAGKYVLHSLFHLDERGAIW